MSILETIKNKYGELKKAEKEYEAFCNRASEVKKHCIEEQQQYMKICHICGSEDFIQSKGFQAYNSHSHIYENGVKVNAIFDASKYPYGADYPLNVRICKKCGNVALFLAFQEVGETFFVNENNDIN